MKKKIQISEGNLISLIKRIVLEQTAKPTVNPIRTKNPFEPTPVQNFNIPQAAVAPPVATGTEDMDDIQTLTQADAYRKQKLAQLAAQRQVVRPTGYRQKDKGPYGLYDQSSAIRKLQKQFNITPDGKLGPMTLKYIRDKFKDSKKTQITDDEISTYIKQSTPDAVGAQTQQPMQNNFGIVNLKGMDGLNWLNNAFYSTTAKSIQLTRTEGDVVLSTNCKLLDKNQVYNFNTKKIVDWSSHYNVIKKLKYNFCSKTQKSIDVSKLIKGNESAIPKNEQNLIFGKAFRAVINPNKSIHIVSDKNAVVLYTDCNNLKTNTFYRHYGQQTYKGKTIVLSALGKAIKPSFCATK